MDKLSPYMFGVPQVRERTIIVGARAGLDHFEWFWRQRSASGC